MRISLVAVASAVAACVLAASSDASALLPGFQPATTGPRGGRLYRGYIAATSGPQPLRPGFLYLPPGFTTGNRYPVVYLLHGLPGDPTEYVDSLALPAVADDLIETGLTKPFIAVIPAAGSTVRYNGEWAGPWERYLVDSVVPWVDAHLPTLATRSGRTLAGLSAGGFGAMDIGLRSPHLFGALESWSGYFRPLHDGPFRAAPARVLAANDPTRLVAEEAPELHRLDTRFFVGSGPSHSHWFTERQSIDFARELERLGLPRTLVLEQHHRGQYALQLAAGLRWAFAP
jgi:S-formylglutathione hydrolase FrmB